MIATENPHVRQIHPERPSARYCLPSPTGGTTTVLGTGAFLGGDLTDPEDDGNWCCDPPPQFLAVEIAGSHVLTHFTVSSGNDAAERDPTAKLQLINAEQFLTIEIPRNPEASEEVEIGVKFSTDLNAWTEGAIYHAEKSPEKVIFRAPVPISKDGRHFLMASYSTR